MNVRSGGAASDIASLTVTVPASAGCTAALFTCSPTGAMMNIVRKSASPMSTWFGGISCVPSACRRK